ncbi:MAG TPA: DUF134 domain-containing protein [Candidatus Eisenbergiella stercorigallinarum]|uniref:UPF0251 protein H9912_12465 n=1 Tax=Candidatus Eisenbergiella stercorigallinarum TaxID=2838557 RepID=A0A9D2R321_9FIRM|nr:DUF134 domain-containing protein [Candidatus Eisenbergiella stercorigallinarum]
MPRPSKERNVCCMPKACRFGPLSEEAQPRPPVRMTVDEYETIRLIDLEGCTQEECARQMRIARSTVQMIYNEARRKSADCLVNGKPLIIEGGNYRLCDGTARCRTGECPFGRRRTIHAGQLTQGKESEENE